MAKKSCKTNSQEFALLLIFLTAVCSPDLLKSQQASAQSATISYKVDHLAGSVGGYGTRDAPGTAARFMRPQVMAGNSRYVFVGDALDLVYNPGAYSIRRIDRVTNEVTTVYDGSSFVAAGPFGALWADETYLYMGQRSSIWRLTIADGTMITFAGAPTAAGFADGVGEQARFNRPVGLWGDGEYLYVVDDGTYSKMIGFAGIPSKQLTPGTIRRIRIATREVQTFPLPAVRIMVAFQPIPTAITGDSNGLYLTYGNSDFGMVRYTPGTGDFTRLPFERDPAIPSSFEPPGPLNLWLDGRGSLYFTATKFLGPAPGELGAYYVRIVVRHLTLATGTVQEVPFETPGHVATTYPTGIWGDADTLYLADVSNTMVSKLDLNTLNASVVAGLPYTTLGASYSTESYVGRPFPPEQFAPSAVFALPDGATLFAIFRNAIYKVSLPNGVITHVVGLISQSGTTDSPSFGSTALLNSPYALWSDGQMLYVAETNSVRQIDLATGRVSHLTTFPAANIAPGLWGDSQFVYWSHDYVVDRIDRANGAVTKLANNLPGEGPLWGDGQYLFSLQYPSNSNASGRQPVVRIALDTGSVGTIATVIPGVGTHGGIWGQDGLLFVALGLTIQSVDPKTGVTRVVAGDTQRMGTEDGIGQEARFWQAQGLSGDGRNLYVADNSIRRLQPIAATTFSIASHGASTWTTNQSGALSVSYGRIERNAGSSSPDGVAIFSYRLNGVLVSETATQASVPTRTGRMVAEIGGRTRSGVAMANPNNYSVQVDFYFTGADGSRVGSGTTTISPNAQIAAFMDEAPFNGTAAARSFTFTASAPVGAIALLGLVNERSEFLMTTLPISTGVPALTTPVLLPHFAAGGGWSTRVLLVNPSNAVSAGVLKTMTSAGEEIGIIPYRVSGASAESIDIPSAENLITGSLRIETDGGSEMPVASTVFSYVRDGVTVTQNGVAQTGTTHSLMLFAESANRFGDPGSARTGVAIANPSSNAISVNLELSGSNGAAVRPVASLTLPPLGQTAFFIDQIPAFSTLPPGFEGTLRISTSSLEGLSAIGLRGVYNERQDFLVATTPYIDDEAPFPNAEKLFPHIVNGDGYTTRFILMTRTAASGTVQLLSQSGEPLR